MGKDLNRHVSRDIGIASRYRKWHSVSPVIMKCQESLPGIRLGHQREQKREVPSGLNLGEFLKGFDVGSSLYSHCIL